MAADTFVAGEKVDITGITKGRGYTGAVKRWNAHILKMTHGTGPIHRQVGSMGANSTPSRVFKNKNMPGQYGNEQVTVLNLEVVKVDAEKNLIAVKGAVPGAQRAASYSSVTASKRNRKEDEDMPEIKVVNMAGEGTSAK